MDVTRSAMPPPYANVKGKWHCARHMGNIATGRGRAGLVWRCENGRHGTSAVAGQSAFVLPDWRLKFSSARYAPHVGDNLSILCVGIEKFAKLLACSCGFQKILIDGLENRQHVYARGSFEAL
jgi:hypothetical protein